MLITSSGWKLHVEQVLVAAVVSEDAAVGDGAGGEDQAALLVGRRVVLGHSEHVKVAALHHGWTDLDLEIQPNILVLLEFVQVFGFLEGLSFLLRSCEEEELLSGSSE